MYLLVAHCDQLQPFPIGACSVRALGQVSGREVPHPSRFSPGGFRGPELICSYAGVLQKLPFGCQWSCMHDFCRLIASFIRQQMPFICLLISATGVLLPSDPQFLQGWGRAHRDL